MLSLALKIVALVLFILATFAVPVPRINATAAGLACWVGSELFAFV